MEQKIEEIRLSADDSFIIKIIYYPDSISEYDNVQVRKIKNGILCKKYLSGLDAAVLKCAYDYSKGPKKGTFITHKTKSINATWPYFSGGDVRPRNYNNVIAFLENYACYFVYEKREGVYWNPNPTLTHEPAKTPERIETISVVDDDSLRIGESSPTDEPDDDRPVTPRKLWEAGRRTYLQSKAGGGRFRLLDIEEQIMPFYCKDDKRTHSKGIDLPIQVRIGESKDESPLAEAIDATHGNLYLIGEGGIGKTTALFRIMEQHYKESPYDPKGEIPLFVALNRAPISFERWYNDPKGFESRFIRMEICRQLLYCDELEDVPEEYVKYITKELKESPADGKPRYLLLLDGLNEVSVDYVKDTNPSHEINGKAPTEQIRQLIIGEIMKLFNDYPNVRIMLTSRTDEINFIHTSHPTEKLYLTGLKEEHIRGYLEKKKFTKKQIDAAIANERLLECLVIPLFLTMYADLSDVSGVTCRGEILSKFFHERGGNITYAQQNIIENLNQNTYHLWFILDFLLPAIGHEMEKKGIFEIQKNEVESIIEPILRGWKPLAQGYEKIETGNIPYDASIIGEYGEQCFEKYRVGRDDVETVAEDILQIEKSITRVTKYVLDNAIDVLKILYYNNGEYSFIHHHFRDYFAAVHDINMLRIAVCANKYKPKLAFESLAPFIANANHREKSIFIGEILGEHHNSPVLVDGKWKYNVPDEPCNRNLTRRALNLFRGRFGEEIGYGVYNLLESIKTVCHYLLGDNLSYLDLTKINFSGFYLGHSNSGGANLEGSKLNMDNLLYSGHNGSVSCIVFSKNNGNKTFLSCSTDGTIKEWDTETNQCVCTYKGHISSVTCIAYAPDEMSFISASDDCTVKEWQIGNPNAIRTYEKHTASVYAVVYITNKVFLSGSRDGTIVEWQVGVNDFIHTYKSTGNWITSLACFPSSNVFISGSTDGTITEWQLGKTTPVMVYKGHSDWVRSVVFNSTGEKFISGSNDSTIKEWKLGIPKELHTYIGHSGPIRSVIYTNENNSILSSSTDGTVKEWSIKTANLICTYHAHKDWVTSIACGSNGQTFFSASYDGSIKEWEFGKLQAIRTIKGCDCRIKCVSYIPNESSFLCGTFDGNVIEWAIDNPKIINTYECYSGSITSIAFLHESNSFLTGTFNGKIFEWAIGNNAVIRSYAGHDESVNCVSINPQNNTFLSGSGDCTVKEWQIGISDAIYKYSGHSAWVHSVTYSHDGKTFLSASYDGTIKEWHTGESNAINTYIGHKEWVRCVTYAPNGKTFLSASYDGTIKEWRIGESKELNTYAGHKEWVRCVTYAPDGKTFLSASYDGTVKEWQVGNPTPIYNYCGHELPVTSVVYSSNGKTFLSSSYDGTVMEWIVGEEKPLKTFKYIPGLFIYGCNMRHLHPESNLSDEDKEILRRYGAIVD